MCIGRGSSAAGLIDTHVQREVALSAEDGQEASKRHQRVTTHIVGQDGLGFAPTGADALCFRSPYLSASLNSHFTPVGIAEFLVSYDQVVCGSHDVPGK